MFISSYVIIYFLWRNLFVRTFIFQGIRYSIMSLNTIMSTAKNTVIWPNFLLWKFSAKAQFPHQEIRWNYGIFSSGLYLFFWLRKGPSTTYATGDWCKMGKNAYSCVQWERVLRLMCTYTRISFHVFGSVFILYIVSCFTCRNLFLPLFKKIGLWEMVIFLQQDQLFLPSWKKFFL